MTRSFKINQGCKQGCSLSPLRFLLVYDIFLKYIIRKKYGYKWKAYAGIQDAEKQYLNMQPAPHNESDTVVIPGSAFMDDMILGSDDPEEFKDMFK